MVHFQCPAAANGGSFVSGSGTHSPRRIAGITGTDVATWQMKIPESRELLDSEVLENLRTLGYESEAELIDMIMSEECVERFLCCSR